MSAHTPSWHAVPDAVGVAGQWRPTDLRGIPATLRYGASLSGVALAAARGRPRKVLLVDDDGPVTGSQLEQAVDAVAAELAAAARRAATRTVAIVAADSRGFLAAVTAAGALGLDALVIPRTTVGRALGESLARVEIAVVDPGTADAVAAAAPSATLVDAEAAAARSPGRSLRSVPRPRSAGTLSLLSSGSTGAPKTTERAGAGFAQLATLLSLMRALELHRDEPVLLAPSLAHGHGLSVLTAALVVGAPAVLAHGHDGPGLVDLVHRHRAGVLAVVPAQLVGVLDALEAEIADGVPAVALPSLRRVATGSAPLTPSTIERAQRLLGDVLVDFYGSSEVGTATIATAEDLRDAPGTVGRPAAGVHVEIVDDDGDPVPVGVVGRVRVSSPWRAGSTEPGHVPVGDLGHLDDEGRLFLDGRADEVAVVGGHNVSLVRVREWFTAQPDVESASVAAVAHDRLGQELVVTVSGVADLDDLRARALAELGPAAAPRAIRRRPAHP